MNKKRKKNWRFFIIVLLVPTITIVSLIYLWTLDAPPIENDYTIDDLRIVPADCAASWDLLCQLGLKEIEGISLSDETSEIGLNEADMDRIDEIIEWIDTWEDPFDCNQISIHADEIEKFWKKTENARDIIRQLDEYPEIADLNEPFIREWNTRMYWNLWRLEKIYRLNVYAQWSRGNYEEVINNLITFDSVIRKLEPNSRHIVCHTMSWVIMALNIHSANYIVNDVHATDSVLNTLQEHFVPFTKEQLNLENSVIFEYINFKNLVTNPSLSYDYTGSNNAWIEAGPLFKTNSTLRFFKSYAFDLPDKEKYIWPEIYPSMKGYTNDQYLTISFIYNC